MDPNFASNSAFLTGVFTLAGAGVGVLGGVIISGIHAWNQRALDRNQALRAWKLRQLQPTLDFANESLAQIDRVSRDYRRVARSSDRARWVQFFQNIEDLPTPYNNLSHSTVIARFGDRSFTPLLFAFLKAYNDCFTEMSNNANAAYGACLMGQPPTSVLPSSDNLAHLMDTILDLNQAVERYVFGKRSPLTFAEATKIVERRQRLFNKLQPWKQRGDCAER